MTLSYSLDEMGSFPNISDASISPELKYHPSLLSDTNIRLDDENWDEIDVSKHQVIWTNTMEKGKYKKSSAYRKVSVLMLCWDGIDLPGMETEVQDLKHVWEQEFGYFVTIEKLGMALDGLRAEVNAVVAGFVKDHDGTDTLLIVYYVRHGNPGELHGVLPQLSSILIKMLSLTGKPRLTI